MVRIDSAVKKIVEDGQNAIAFTEHGNLASVVKAHDACRKYKVKQIIGMEAYISPDSRLRKKYEKGEHSASHLILLAKTETGWNNLKKLSTLSYTEGFYKKPRIDCEILARYSEGLIVTSACIGGAIAVHLQRGLDAEGEGKCPYSENIALGKLSWFQQTFGDNFYAELQYHGADHVQAKLNDWYRRNVPHDQIICSTDCHYLNEEDYDTHDTLLCCNTASNKHDPERWRFPTNQCWLKTTDEMSTLFNKHELENTQKIADQIDFELPLRKQWFVPDVPKDIYEVDTKATFTEKCWQGLYQKLNNDVLVEYVDRLEYEMAIIIKAGFVEYILVLWDVMQFCQREDIMVGVGRGSAVGSIVCWVLGITGVDPIARKLPFERFINPGRLERFAPPDIDLDFQREHRQRIIQYLRDRYGEKNVCQIGTYSTFGPAKLVKKLCQVLGIDLGIANKITSIIPEGESSLQGAGPAAEPHGLSLDDVWTQSNEFRQIIEQLGESGLYLLHYARGLRSLGTHASTHASGIIIASKPVDEIIPLMVAKPTGSKEEITLAQLDMQDVEAFGLIKFDILGLITLDILKSVERQIRKNDNPNFNFDNIDLDDPQIYKLLTSGRTMGIFQAAGGGYVRLLQQAKPTCVEDLAVLNSLCRPGPMLSGDTATYINRRNGQEQVSYLFPELKSILGRTFGCLAFQEDIMAIANQCAGFSLAEADDLRKVMGKKQVDKIPKYREQFINGLMEHSKIDREAGETLWSQILPMAEYVFNRSHAMAYSYLTAQTAWAKHYYPAYFLAACLTAENESTKDNIPTLIRDAQMMGCTLIPPDVNYSGKGFIALDKKIIMLGLDCIRGVGPASVEYIVEERNQNGYFLNSINWRERIAPRHATSRVLDSLHQSGCFDQVDNITTQITLDKEYDLFGFHISGHPCQIGRPQWQKEISNLVTLKEIDEDWRTEKKSSYGKYGNRTVEKYKEHRTRVMITNVIKKKSKKDGKFMQMLDLEDETGTIKMIMNASQMNKFNNPELKKGSLVDIIGRKSDPKKWAGYLDASMFQVII